MFCPNCGKELLDDARFCDACGTPVVSQDAQTNDGTNEQAAPATPNIYADYPQTAVEPPKPRKKKRFLKITAIILAVVVLLAGVTVLGYHTFLPAKLTLTYAQRHTLQKAWNYLDQSMTRGEKKLDYFIDTPVKTDTTISLKLDPELLTAAGLDKEMAEFVMGYLNNIAFQYVSEVDIANKKQNVNLNLNYMNNPVFTLNAFIDNDRLGLALPQLSERGIVGRFKDIPRLEELYPYIFDSSILETISNINPWLSYDLNREFRIDHKDLKKLQDTYGMFLVNTIDGSDMSIRRGRTTELFGEDIRCQEVTITLDQRAQMELVKSLLDTMAEDDTLYNTVFAKVARLFEIISASNPELAENLPGMDMENFLSKSQIRMLLNSAKRSLNKDMFPEEAIIRAYIQGYDVVKYELEIPGDLGETFLFTYECLVDDDDFRMRLSFLNDSDYNGVNAHLDIDHKYDKASDTTDLTVGFEIKPSDDSGYVTVSLKSTEDPDGSNKVKRLIDLSVDFDVGSGEGNLNISADAIETRNKDGMPANVDGTVDFYLGGDGLPLPKGISLTLGFESDFQYDITVKTPDWASNAIDLGTATIEDLEDYFEEITDTISNLISMAQYLF